MSGPGIVTVLSRACPPTKALVKLVDPGPPDRLTVGVFRDSGEEGEPIVPVESNETLPADPAAEIGTACPL